MYALIQEQSHNGKHGTYSRTSRNFGTNALAQPCTVSVATVNWI